MKDRLQLVGAVILTTAILLFAYQNLDGVPIKFLIWEFTSSVSLVTLTTFLGGLLTGAAGVVLRQRKKKKELPGEERKAKNEQGKAKDEERKAKIEERKEKPKALPEVTPAAKIDLAKQADDGGLSDADRQLLMEAGLGDKEEK